MGVGLESSVAIILKVMGIISKGGGATTYGKRRKDYSIDA